MSSKKQASLPRQARHGALPFLSVAAICERAITEKDDVLSMIRIVDRVTVTGEGPEAPAEMPTVRLNPTIVLAFKGGDAVGAHTVQVEFESPEGESVLPTREFPIALDRPESGAAIVLQATLELSKVGTYWVAVSVDGQLMTKLPYEILYAQAQDQER